MSRAICPCILLKNIMQPNYLHLVHQNGQLRFYYVRKETA